MKKIYSFRIPLVSMLLAFLLASAASLQANRSDYPSFDKDKDLLLAQFDSLPDPDDIHSQAALGSMLIHPDLAGVEYYGVLGAIGDQIGWRDVTASDFKNPFDLMELIFGLEGDDTWTDAWDGGSEGNNWRASVDRIVAKVKPILENGGIVWVQEAGQSNITRDWLHKLINDENMDEALVKQNVIVVQHSSWNNDRTNSDDLSYVKAKATHVKIADGNKGNNDTPDYNINDKSFLENGLSTSNPNTKARDFWQKAKDVIDREGTSGGHNTIPNGGVDCSDCVENWWIFEIGTDADTLQKFFDRYVTNEPTGPRVNAGSDQELAHDVPTTTISATAEEVGAATFEWTQLGGPGTAVFSSATSLTTDITLPAAGIYDIRITVYGSNFTISDDLRITLKEDVGSNVYFESEGIVVMEAENTASNLDKWVLSTSIADYSGSGFLEFTGNSYQSGSASSPLTYTFTIQNGGVYRLVPRAATTRPSGTPSDQGNDIYLKMEGDFTSGGSANLTDLQNNQKFFTILKNANQWVWGRQFDMNNSHDFHEADYNLKAGETYTLTVSGRSKSYSLDRIVLYRRSDWSANQAQDLSLKESGRGSIGPGQNLSPVVELGSDATVPNSTTSYEITGVVTDDGKPEGGSLSYVWTQVDGPSSTISSPTNLTTSVTLPEPGSYTFRLTANDGDRDGFDQIVIKRQIDLGNIIYAINCGGGDYTSTAGIPYEADNYYTSGDSYSKSSSISGTDDDELFYSERYAEAPASVDYAFPVSNGDYQINLMWSENTGSGRLMDVMLEGQLAIDALDVVALAGSNKTAYEQLLDVTVTDGVLNLSVGSDSNATENFPNIMAIEVLSSEGPTPTNNAPSVDLGADVELSSNATSTYLDATVSDDGLPAGNGLTYIWTQVSGPSTVSFGSDSSEDTTVKIPAAGTYVLRLTADDGALSGSDDISIIRHASGSGDPDNEQDKPVLDDTVVSETQSGKEMTISIRDAKGGTYHLEHSLNLDGSWDLVPGMVQTGVQEGDRVEMVPEISGDKGFYRIVYTRGL